LARAADGIKIDIYDGSANVRAWHNTVVDAFNGVDLFVDASATVTGSARANVFAYLTSTALQRSGNVAAFTDADNLFFQSSETPSTPGLSATSVFADPQLKRVPDDPRLLPGSPAVDHLLASTLTDVLSAENLPFTDGDGLRRVKRANTAAVSSTLLDLGALEAGDVSLLLSLPATPAVNTTLIDNAALNAISDAYPLATANWNPDHGIGIYNNHPVSLRYITGSLRWQLREEDLATFTASSRFNIFAPAAGDGRYLHANTAGNTTGAATTLNMVGLNGRSDRIVLALRNPGTGTVTDVASPVGVGYAASSWSVSRLDGGAMPSNGGFDVYFQEPSINAFRHTSSAGNSAGNVSYLEHPLLNAHACARFHVAPSTAGTLNNHNIGVFYSTGNNRWAIFNQDFATIPTGAEFHVVVDPGSIECTEPLFANGFE
jgi:hypothetical protein